MVGKYFRMPSDRITRRAYEWAALLIFYAAVSACVYVPPVWEQATEEEIRSIKVGITDRATIKEYFGEPNILDHDRFIVHRGRKDSGFFVIAAGYGGAVGGFINEKSTHLAIEFDDAGIVRHIQVERSESEKSLSRKETSFRRHLRVSKEENDFANSLAFSSSGRYLAVGDSGNRIFLWDLRSTEEPRVFTGKKSCGFFTHCNVDSVAFSPDETRLAAAMVDDTVIVWDRETKRQLYSLDTTWSDFWGGDHIAALSFSYDGRVLATGDDDGKLTLWDGATGRRLQEIAAHESGISALAYSKDGRWLVTASRDGTSKVWLTDSFSNIDQIEREIPLTALSFSEDGNQLAVGSEFHIELWDVGNSTETHKRTPFGRLSDVFAMPVRDGYFYVGQSISLSSNSQRLIGIAGAAVIWNVETRQIEAELVPWSNCCAMIPSFGAAAFYPESDLIITVGFDGVKVWDVPN